MKILLATDGSTFSDAAAREVARRHWDSGSELKVISVVEPPTAAPPEAVVMSAEYFRDAEKASADALDKAMSILKAGENKELNITTATLAGSPKKMILEEAERWGADLIVVGSHGYKALRRFLLGSVSQAVALHANCSVEIVRSHDQT